jgi:hypothetical protein
VHNLLLLCYQASLQLPYAGAVLYLCNLSAQLALACCLVPVRPPAAAAAAACSEDYNWWWRSYFTSGSSALYLFAYSAFYFYSKLDITKVCADSAGVVILRYNV